MEKIGGGKGEKKGETVREERDRCRRQLNVYEPQIIIR